MSSSIVNYFIVFNYGGRYGGRFPFYGIPCKEKANYSCSSFWILSDFQSKWYSPNWFHKREDSRDTCAKKNSAPVCLRPLFILPGGEMKIPKIARFWDLRDPWLVCLYTCSKLGCATSIQSVSLEDVKYCQRHASQSNIFRRRYARV